MNKLMITAILAMGFSQVALAHGQENEGTLAPAAHGVEITCDSDDGSVSVSVIQTEDGRELANIIAESFGGSYPTYRYLVRRKNVPAGMMGAGLTFLGHGLTLRIGTDMAPRPEGSPASLNIPGLGIDNQVLHCKFR